MIERSGRLMLTDVHFEDDDHVKFTIDRIAAGMNRRCDEASPLCDCTIVRPGTPFNGSRVNAVLKGVAVDHHLINIRKFRKDALTPEALMANGSFDSRMLGSCAPSCRAACPPSWPAAPDRARRRCSTQSRSTSRPRSASSPSRTRPSCA
ncbi:MAG: hypothetical protein ACLT5H_06260 [Collinsella stercoris]|uniref:hypothetical protein n=1 Tax=Collinsella stercoris TaxID=147206 RepID=UPI003993EAF5